MSNPNTWQNQNGQQPSRWQNGSNWGGYAQQPQQQASQQQPSQPQTYQQPYQGGYQGGYQQPYQGGYQQPAYGGARSAYQQEPAKARAAGKKQFIAAMLFAAIFAVTCLYGFLFSGAANWTFTMNANVKVLTVLSTESFYAIAIVSLAMLSGVFLVLGVFREHFSWAAAVACWMWSAICILTLVSVMTLDGFFNRFQYAAAKELIYYILTLASQLAQTVIWLIVGILFLTRSKSGAKTVLTVIAMVLSAAEFVYPLCIGMNVTDGTGFWAILMMIVIGLFGVLISRGLAVLLYKPGRK